MCRTKISRRSTLIIALSQLGLFVGNGPVRADGRYRLIMVEEAGCVYCARWHAEVGQAYARSAEGRFAPLAPVRIGDASISNLIGLRYTPTFVLVEGPREIGRITGYPGADFFWSLLAELLAKTSFAAPPSEDIKT